MTRQESEPTAADWYVIRIWEHDDPLSWRTLVEAIVTARALRGEGPECGARDGRSMGATSREVDTPTGSWYEG